MSKLALGIATASALLVCGIEPAGAHHSFAMYDVKKTYVFTGVVLRVNPDPNHLQIFFAPLNDARDDVVRDDGGEPLAWAVEMESAGQAAKHGITVDSFPRGTVFSVGLHPLRNGLPAGGRGKLGLFRCPGEAVPAPGKHCNSVPGATSHGEGALPADAGPVPADVVRGRTKNDRGADIDGRAGQSAAPSDKLR